jgi:UDP-N-acetylglucosamine--N-acetylmuramyl-(pentapeptide) pyrophosphoryl-undecaprenol N-acetylglucosamine transferase
LSNNSTISSSFQNPRIIIAGGGTGGHIFPALAIAEAIRNRCPAEILFVGAKGKMEMQKIPQAGYKIIGINIAGYNRSSLLKNITLPLKLLKSFFQVSGILKTFKPHAVIGVGGYSSFPVLRVAQSKNIPTFIHESNSFAGKSNIMLGKKATKIFVAYEGMSQFFPSKKIVISGNPVRNIFSTSNAIRSEALEYFGLKPEKKTVLVVGGSLGAMSINRVIERNIEYFNKNDIQLIWQTGGLYAAEAANTEIENNNIWSNAFIDRMELAYTAADIVVSRSGAMAVAELSIVGKPVIFVPYPHAAEDHQAANAQSLVSKRAALMIKDSDVNDKLINAIDILLDDESLRMELRNNISKLKNTQADERIAEEILNAI